MSGIHKKQVTFSTTSRLYGGVKRLLPSVVLFLIVRFGRHMPAFEELQSMALQKTSNLLGAALHPRHLVDALRCFTRSAGRLFIKVFQQVMAVLFQRTFVAAIVVGE